MAQFMNVKKDNKDEDGSDVDEDPMDVCHQLSVMFPQYGRRELRDCVAVVLTTLTEPNDRERLLNGCIDWLLALPPQDEVRPDLLNESVSSEASSGTVSSQESPRSNVPGPSHRAHGRPLLESPRGRPQFHMKWAESPSPILPTDLKFDARPGVAQPPPILQPPGVVPPPLPPAPVKPSLDDQMARLIELFPQVEPNFMREQLVDRQMEFEVAADWIANQPKANVPRRPVIKPTEAKADRPVGASAGKAVAPAVDDVINLPELSEWRSWREFDAADYYDQTYEAELRSDGVYENGAITLICGEHKEINMNDVRRLVRYFGSKYAPASKALQEAVDTYLANNEDVKSLIAKRKTSVSLALTVNGAVVPFNVKIMANRRNWVANMIDYIKCPALLKEAQWCRYQATRLAQKAVMGAAEAQKQREREENLTRARAAGDVYDCPICCDGVLFEDLVACLDGHTFCAACLRQYATEAVYGHGKAFLFCLDGKCDHQFARGELERALPREILDKLDERVQQENIQAAGMEDLYRCACGYAAVPEVPAEVDKVFRCHQCAKETCRVCGNEWDEQHFGKSCKEMETKDEELMRKQFDEKMAEAIIRHCHKCKTALMKEEGCNKMTCRCGATLCYLCKKPNIDYAHFCQHVLDPGTGCKLCQNPCMLWEKPEIRDSKALQELEKQKEEEKRKRQLEEPNNNQDNKRQQTAPSQQAPIRPQ